MNPTNLKSFVYPFAEFPTDDFLKSSVSQNNTLHSAPVTEYQSDVLYQKHLADQSLKELHQHRSLLEHFQLSDISIFLGEYCILISTLKQDQIGLFNERAPKLLMQGILIANDYADFLSTTASFSSDFNELRPIYTDFLNFLLTFITEQSYNPIIVEALLLPNFFNLFKNDLILFLSAISARDGVTLTDSQTIGSNKIQYLNILKPIILKNIGGIDSKIILNALDQLVRLSQLQSILGEIHCATINHSVALKRIQSVKNASLAVRSYPPIKMPIPPQQTSSSSPMAKKKKENPPPISHKKRTRDSSGGDETLMNKGTNSKKQKL